MLCTTNSDMQSIKNFNDLIVNINSENKEISDSNKTVYTIWGDSDSVVVYNQIKDKLNKLLPNRFEYIVPNSGHLPHIENQVDFEKYLFEVVLK